MLYSGILWNFKFVLFISLICSLFFNYKMVLFFTRFLFVKQHKISIKYVTNVDTVLRALNFPIDYSNLLIKLITLLF